MKFTIERVAICILIFVITIMIMRDCSRPSEEREEERERLFKTTIEVLEAEKAEIQSKQEAIVKVYKDRLVSDSLNLALQDSRIKSLKSKLANQRPKVIEKIQADTAVLSYVETLEETVNELQIQNDTLKAQKEFHRKLNEDLIAQEYIEDRIEADMAIKTTMRIAELEKQSRRKERKSRLKTILIPVVAVGAFLLGANL